VTTGDSDGKDPFADAKANLRDTVKWLAATFAALAAVVIGTSPLSGLGELEICSAQFLIASVALLVGFGCICCALYVTLRILRPEAIYRSDLLRPLPEKAGDPNDRELADIRHIIDEHATDILPYGYGALAELAAATATTKGQLDELYLRPKSYETTAEIRKGESLRREIDVAVDNLLGLGLYLRLQVRLQDAIPWLFGFGISALLALGIFGIAAHEKKNEVKPDSTRSQNIVINSEPVTASPKYPALLPILFDTGKAALSEQSYRSIEVVREQLRAHPEAALLLVAHTDTVASDAINTPLAHLRALAVLSVLRGVGGIPAGRIFTTELPKSDLPVLTPLETASTVNRSVELKLIKLDSQ
jgi:outer membrane protein OmpA-like peptidoglycan-associated protein